jgi:hypothetical protein
MVGCEILISTRSLVVGFEVLTAVVMNLLTLYLMLIKKTFSLYTKPNKYFH